jgi:tol-pal system protein YbgF
MKKAILVAAVLAVSAWATLLQAQVQVVEPGAGQGQSRAGNTSGAGGNDLLISLYNQLEALQQEVQTLRGIVEEQSNRVRRLETETRDRYLDMDSRLSALSTGATVPGTTGAAANTAAVGVTTAATTSPQAVQDVRTSVPFNPVVQGADLSSPPAARNPSGAAPVSQGAIAAAGVDAAANQMSEQDLYRSALNLLLEEGKAEESAATFNVYLQRFPDGRLLPNALYWQGEALILLSRYPEAQAAFERVLNEFPGDAKAAGALLKTGVVQNLLGNRSAAESIWRELPGRFPDSASEITLARDYLSRP